MDNLDTLAKRLTWARARKALTQEELAKAAKVSQSTIGNLEAGIRSTARKIAVIAKILDVDALWLATGEEPPTKNEGNNVFPIEFKAYAEKKLAKEIAFIAQVYGLSDVSGRELLFSSASSLNDREKLGVPSPLLGESKEN